jgi:hypothetical protein
LLPFRIAYERAESARKRSSAEGVGSAVGGPSRSRATRQQFPRRAEPRFVWEIPLDDESRPNCDDCKRIPDPISLIFLSSCFANGTSSGCF